MGARTVFRSILQYRPPHAMPSEKIITGVFAINKPLGVSSAQVIRNLQKDYFREADLFQPWLLREEKRRNEDKSWRRKRRDHHPLEVKIGHGGTLDPEATGVLVLAVGAATKALSTYTQNRTKAYECVVLFGASTDSYDAAGKVNARKPFDQVTRAAVEKALEKFRGDIMQRPPAYSAKWVGGKRSYEYAREGLTPPTELQERALHVENLEMVEWFEGGSHAFHWPTAELKAEEPKAEAGDGESKAMHEATSTELKLATDTKTREKVAGSKRERDADVIDGKPDVTEASSPSPKRHRTSDEPAVPVAIQDTVMESADDSATLPEHPSNNASPVPRSPCPAPACRLRMSVSSGFYVRSLCHDLGIAVGSLGLMATLVRTRQGEFELGKNVLEYAVLDEGEKVWGPQVETMLNQWVARAKASGNRDLDQAIDISQKIKKNRGDRKALRRRNSSSPEA